MYLKTKDIQNMETKTEASKVWKPIMQINRYTAEQLEQEIKNRNLRRKLMLNSLKVKGYDLVVDSTRRIWELVDASEEIIGDRLDVLREMYEADLKMPASERLERNKGLDFYNNVIDDLKKILNYYVYIDLAKNPPQPSFDKDYFPKVDTYAELKKIRSELTEETNYYDFFRKIRILIDSYRDAHMSYGLRIFPSYYAFLCPIKSTTK